MTKTFYNDEMETLLSGISNQLEAQRNYLTAHQMLTVLEILTLQLQTKVTWELNQQMTQHFLMDQKEKQDAIPATSGITNTYP